MEAQEHIKHMTEVIKQMRDFVRKEGYVSAMTLAMQGVDIGHCLGEDVDFEHLELLLTAVAEAPDIHVTEYTNSTVADFRVKDLYYFNPHKTK